jgi:hypothetical protein
MAFALVYTGEHYFVDVLAGWIYCIAVYAAVEGVAVRPVPRMLLRAPLVRAGIVGAAADEGSRYAPAD